MCWWCVRVPVLAFLGLVWRLCVGVGAVCRGPSPISAVGSGCGSPLAGVCWWCVPPPPPLRALPPLSLCRVGRGGVPLVRARAFPAVVGGGGSLSLARVPSPGVSPLGRRPWWTYLSQLRLSVHHIQGIKNECANYISRNNFEDMTGARSEEIAKEAFRCMDVHLDLNMTMIRPLDGLKQVEYLKELQDIYRCLEKPLEPVPVNQEQWKRDETCLWHEDLFDP